MAHMLGVYTIVERKSDEHPDRQCPNCGSAIDVDLLQEPDDDRGILLLCPKCNAELPWSSIAEVPRNNWVNSACLDKEDYPARERPKPDAADGPISAAPLLVAERIDGIEP